MICDKVLTSAQNLTLHMKTAHADEKPCFDCWFCNATFTRQSEEWSEEKNFKNEWQFAESRPIEHGEHNVCPCGQTHIETYFFVENKWTGNRTFVGSDCVTNVDPKAAAVIGYFKHILENTV